MGAERRVSAPRAFLGRQPAVGVDLALELCEEALGRRLRQFAHVVSRRGDQSANAAGRSASLRELGRRHVSARRDAVPRHSGSLNRESKARVAGRVSSRG